MENRWIGNANAKYLVYMCLQPIDSDRQMDRHYQTYYLPKNAVNDQIN